MGIERRRRRVRRPSTPETTPKPSTTPDGESGRAPSPQDLAGLGGTFAMTTTVGDPVEAEPAAAEAPEAEPAGSVPARAEPAGAAPADARGVAFEPTGSDRDDQQLERGLRGLVGGGSSQVSVSAAMRARDAARPTEADLATAARDLPVIRRGWIPREDLPPRAPRR